MLTDAGFLALSYAVAVIATIAGFGSSTLLIPAALMFMDAKTAVVLIAFVVDLIRIPTYLFTKVVHDPSYYILLPFLLFSAYLGVKTGRILLEKIKQELFEKIVLAALLLVGINLIV